MFRIPPGAFAPQVGQLELIIVHRRRAAVDHQLLLLHLPEQLFDEHEGELDLIGNFAAGGVAARQQEFQNQRFHFALGQSCRAERDGFFRKVIIVVAGGRCGTGRGCFVGRPLSGQPCDASQQLVEFFLALAFDLRDGIGFHAIVIGRGRLDGGPRFRRSVFAAATGQPTQQFLHCTVGHGRQILYDQKQRHFRRRRKKPSPFRIETEVAYEL